MALPQTKFREVVFQLLYGQVVGGAEASYLIALLSNELKISRREVRRAQQKAEAVMAALSELDAAIRETSQEYALERIPSVERNVLRLGAYELLRDESIPPKVAIAEAIRLAKKFSTPEAANFVNALLDQLYIKEPVQVAV